MIWSCGVLISRYIKQSSAKSRTRVFGLVDRLYGTGTAEEQYRVERLR